MQLSIYRNFSYKILEKLENGTIDVGIVTLPVKSASLKTHAIYRDQLMWMVNPQNPLAKQETVSLAEIAKQPILLPKTGYTRRLMDKLLRPYKAQLAGSDGTAQRRHDQELRGCGPGRLVDQREFRARPGAGGPREIDAPKEKELWRELAIAYRRDRTLTRATSHLHRDRAPARGRIQVTTFSDNLRRQKHANECAVFLFLLCDLCGFSLRILRFKICAMCRKRSLETQRTQRTIPFQRIFLFSALSADFLRVLCVLEIL